MADRISLKDFDGHEGCRHGLEDELKTAVRQFFTSPPSDVRRTIRELLQLHLEQVFPKVAWDTDKIAAAVRTVFEDGDETGDKVGTVRAAVVDVERAP